MNDNLKNGDSGPTSSVEAQKSFDDQLLEQIAALEADTESPIAIGKEVRVKDDEGEITKGGWIVDSYAIEEPPRGNPYVVAVVIQKGGKLAKKVSLGILSALN